MSAAKRKHIRRNRLRRALKRERDDMVGIEYRIRTKQAQLPKSERVRLP